LFSAILPGLGNYCFPAAGLDFRRIHGKFGARNRCNFRTFSAEFSFWICVFRGWTPGSFAAEGIAMALHSVMMQARALHHDHFQQLSASQSSFVSPISSSRNQFRSFTPKGFGCCRPVTGSFSQCALSLKGGGRGGRAPPGVSCFPGSLRYRKRSADGRRMWHIAAQPSEPSTSTFNEEDYEEHEDTEEEARRRNWVERRLPNSKP